MHDYCNEFVNAWLEGKEVEIPEFLYKYRPFDEHSFDMLENEYIYLCKARRLDDPSECKATYDLDDYYNIETGCVKSRAIDLILDYLRPYSTTQHFEIMRRLVNSAATPGGEISGSRLLMVAIDMQECVSGINVAPFINYIRDIPERLDKPEIQELVKTLFHKAKSAHEEMGICSLSEHSNSPEMWEDYADGSSGYCIEYHTKGYKRSGEIFPVSYTDRRNTDIVFAILAAMIGKLVQELSNGEMVTDKSQYFCLFLTKNTKWQHQKEWRIIGNAGEKAKAPPIKTIYVGRNAKPENAERIKKFCLERGIGFIQR